MNDNVYKVLMGDNAPFLGLANISYYDRTWKGEIVDVHYDELITKSIDGKPVLNRENYRTVDIRWLEGKPFTSKNVHIPEYLSFKGGYGINYLPMKGDIVLASFSPTNEPYIITIVSRCSVYNHGMIYDDGEVIRNEYGDPKADTAIDPLIRPTPFRRINPGEISITSLNNNGEIYLDKNGTTKIISREIKVSDAGGVQCGNRLWELSLGQDIYKETEKGATELKKSSFGNNIQFQVLGHQNNCKVDFDEKGNIEIKNNGSNIKIETNGNFNIETDTGNKISLEDNKITISNNSGSSITMQGNNIQLGDNANYSAVLGESLFTLLTSMITVFNTHTHQGVMSGTSSTTPTITPMVIQDFLSKTIKLKE